MYHHFKKEIATIAPDEAPLNLAAVVQFQNPFLSLLGGQSNIAEIWLNCFECSCNWSHQKAHGSSTRQFFLLETPIDVVSGTLCLYFRVHSRRKTRNESSLINHRCYQRRHYLLNCVALKTVLEEFRFRCRQVVICVHAIIGQARFFNISISRLPLGKFQG